MIGCAVVVSNVLAVPGRDARIPPRRSREAHPKQQHSAEARCEGTQTFKKPTISWGALYHERPNPAVPKAACSLVPTNQTSWPVRKARTRYAASALMTTSPEAMAATPSTSSTAGRATTS